MFLKIQFKEAIILLLIFAVYLFSIGKDPILGDSLGFTVQAAKGFDWNTNSTNHFLYTNLLTLLHKIFSGINPHVLFTFFSVCCAVFSLFIFRRLLFIFGVVGKNADAAVLLMAFSFTFWRVSIITEVYSFYIMLVLLFFYFAFSTLKNNFSKNPVWTAVLFGLLFTVHIQTILLVPFYLYFLYCWYKANPKNFYVGIVTPALFFGILLIPVLFGDLPFISIFSDTSYHQQFFHFEMMKFLKSVARNLVFFIYNFLIFIPFIFLGIKKVPFQREIALVFVPCFLFLLKHEVSDSYVFQLVPYIFLFLLVGKGLERSSGWSQHVLVLLFPLFYFFTYKIAATTSFGKKINQETGFKGGVRYFFFPPLNHNPDISEFMKAYEENRLQNQTNFDGQYHWAKQWQEIKKQY